MNKRKLFNLQMRLFLSYLIMGLTPIVVLIYYKINHDDHIVTFTQFYKEGMKFIGEDQGLYLSTLVSFAIAALIMSYLIVGGLKSIFKDIRSYANKTLKTTSLVKEAAQSVSSATTEQASAIQETVATLNEINAMVSRSVENAVRSSKLSDHSSKMAKEGHKTVDAMVKAIEDINQSNENIMSEISESNERITEIVEVISQISEKTKVINDIVFQTKLLSFNASVEAARAGEHGKGFAVVAEEVGSLAQMSGNAAKEISGMLSESIAKVENIVNKTKFNVEKLIQDGREKVNSGVVIAKRCGEVLDDVVKNVNDVNNMIGEIAEASKQQADGVNNISTAMNQLDDSTHSNADTAYKSLEYSADLSDQSQSLGDCIKKLEVDVFGFTSGEETEVEDRNITSASRRGKVDYSKKSKVSEMLKKTQKSISRDFEHIGPGEASTIDFVENFSSVITEDKDSNVLSMKSKKGGKSSAFNNPETKKIAVGSEEIPSESDPRFEDI